MAGTYGVAVDGEYLYWTVKTSDGNVAITSKVAGGGSATIAGQSYPSHILADGKSVYWVTEGNDPCTQGSGSVVRIPAGLTGTPQEPLANGMICATNLVNNEIHVYWGAGTMIYRVNR